MKTMLFAVLMIVIVSILIGCGSADKVGDAGGNKENAGGNREVSQEDTGISDVFRDAEEVNPPEIPS